MKKVLRIMILGLFLTGLIGVVIADDNNSPQKGGPVKYGECGDDVCNYGENTSSYPYYCPQDCKNQITNITKSQIKEMIQERNRIHFESKTGQNCTEGCKCEGVVMKCNLGNGTRQMSVYAQSGNVMIQTKSVNASTTIELYKENGTLVGVFKGNKTKQIKMTPEQIKEKIQERLQQRDCDCQNITLDEDGYYKVQTQKEAKFLGLFKVKERVNWEIDPETGEITRTKNSWWGWLARDVKNQEQLVGASCGTVTPGYNDECCQNKGYDSWDSEKGECLFNAAE